VNILGYTIAHGTWATSRFFSIINPQVGREVYV